MIPLQDLKSSAKLSNTSTPCNPISTPSSPKRLNVCQRFDQCHPRRPRKLLRPNHRHSSFSVFGSSFLSRVAFAVASSLSLHQCLLACASRDAVFQEQEGDRQTHTSRLERDFSHVVRVTRARRSSKPQRNHEDLEIIAPLGVGDDLCQNLINVL